MPDDDKEPSTFREFLGLDDGAKLPWSKVKDAAGKEGRWGDYAKEIVRHRERGQKVKSDAA